MLTSKMLQAMRSILRSGGRPVSADLVTDRKTMNELLLRGWVNETRGAYYVLAKGCEAVASADEALRNAAEAQVSAFPQYAGRFSAMRVGLAVRTVRTKAGVAMEKGDFVLVEAGSDAFVTIWSARNRCLTSVPAAAVSQ